jgi:hypothetical protein
MRTRLFVGAATAVLALAGQAGAQSPGFKPIDTNQLVVAPSDATAGVTSNSIRLVGRTIANTIENNGIVRTINNLLGKKPTTAPAQPGFSAYPSPTTYQSTQYQSVIKPVMPQSSLFGQTSVVK